MNIVEELRNKKSRDNRDLLDRAADRIEELELLINNPKSNNSEDMSNKQIELLEKQLAFWKHHCTVLSKELTKEEEISNRYAKMLDETEEELNEERVKSEWISVEERLPETNKKFLVCYSNGSMDIAKYIRVDGFELWFEETTFTKHITHWMPLPEAPKMKGGE